MLYVIDSSLMVHDPKVLDRLSHHEIAGRSVIRDKDSLKRLGREKADAVTYIFTRAYYNRPDSLRKIPGLRQMEILGGYWHLRGVPYSGRFIDYFINGKVSNEGTLLNGTFNGEITLYFLNGQAKTMGFYKEGIYDGVFREYYRNGALRSTVEYRQGVKIIPRKTFYINGQVEQEIKPGKGNRRDTVITYYSSGKIKHTRFFKKGITLYSKKQEKLNTLTREFIYYMARNDLKIANRCLYALWKLDPDRPDTYYLEGLMALRESRFNAAIEAFDKALEMEPMLQEAYLQRALARFRKYNAPAPKEKYDHRGTRPERGRKEAPLRWDQPASLPAEEKEKISRDLLQSDNLNYWDD